MLAYRGAAPLRAGTFLAEVHALAACLPAGGHVINACADRYRFAVGLGAAMLGGKLSLLPPNHTPEVVRHLKSLFPDVFCLTDAPRPIDIPQFHYPALSPRPCPWQPPLIEATRAIAVVFTSGSTGIPVAHTKTWGRLLQGVRAGALRLALEPGTALLATVPAQHMYGLESSVLLPLATGAALCAEQPFYPADICHALASLPRPRVLLTTPLHLRALMACPDPLPQVDRIVSATAPLGPALALEAEERLRAPLSEIYGSTETGQLATRASTRTEAWELLPGVTLTIEAGRAWARGGHLEQPTALADRIALLDAAHMVLQGRLADLVNIAGKRSSLAYLTHQLLDIPGVCDGAFFLPATGARTEQLPTRVAAAAVAPRLSAADIRTALRGRIDPVFLPRPLLLLDRLPRNSTGKLPLAALHALLANTGGAAR